MKIPNTAVKNVWLCGTLDVDLISIQLDAIFVVLIVQEVGLILEYHVRNPVLTEEELDIQ